MDAGYLSGDCWGRSRRWNDNYNGMQWILVELVEYVVIKRWEHVISSRRNKLRLQWPQPQKKILPAFLGNVWLCNLHNNGSH
jgi:hypothetical protein